MIKRINSNKNKDNNIIKEDNDDKRYKSNESENINDSNNDNKRG